MDGTYQLKLSAPTGDQSAILTMKTDGEKFTGTLEMMGMKQELKGSIKGNEFQFSLETRKMFMKVKVSFKGTIIGDTLEGIADSNFGSIRVTGSKLY